MPKHILIVDDNAAVRTGMREVLERQEGWEVCAEAANGREGIETVERLKPDLIVLDLSMPVMNGLEAARELQRRFPSVPVLMYSIIVDLISETEQVFARSRELVERTHELIEQSRRIKAQNPWNLPAPKPAAPHEKSGFLEGI